MDELLIKLTQALKIPGEEKGIIQEIKEELEGLNCTIEEDEQGNIITKLGAGEEKYLVSADVDTIGFQVYYIDEDGFVRARGIGDFSMEDFPAQTIVFRNGIKGRISKENSKSQNEEIYIDLGANNKEEVYSLIREGDCGIVQGNTYQTGNYIFAPNLNNRLGVYILLKVIRELSDKDLNREVFFVFSSSFEVGRTTIEIPAKDINPKVALVVNAIEAQDGVKVVGNIKLGSGPVLRLMDKNLVIDNDIKEGMVNTCELLNLHMQYSTSGKETEGGVIAKKLGIKTGVVSVPIRYLNTPSEMASISDTEDSIRLISKFLAR